MNDADVQKEWNKLVEAYEGMSDEELTSLAEQPHELTDLARQAIQAEVKARNLSITLADAPADSPESAEEEPRGDLDPAELDLLPINRVWEASEAQEIMKALYEAGIPAYLGPEYAEKIADFRGRFEDGVDIQVRAVDQQRALAALAEALQKAGDSDAQDETYVAHCPVCGSDEVVFEELVAAASALGSSTAQKFRWRCDSCGHEWEDDGVEE